MLRAVVCGVLLLLFTCQGGALKCYTCMSMSSSALCTDTFVLTCSPADNACGAVSVSQPVPFSLRGCMNMAVCQNWIRTPYAAAICCSTDLCN